MYQPGTTAVVEFAIASSTGAAVNADSLPVGTSSHNGVDDGATVAVTNIDTGRYKASWPISSGYAGGDSIALSIAATVGGVAAKEIVMNAALSAAPTSAATIASTLLATAVPNSNTAGTVADALNAARAQGFGKWTLVGTTLTLYGSDGTTAVRTFTLDSSTAPTTRT